MATTQGEPTTQQEVTNWVEKAICDADRFHYVSEASHRHREEHGRACTVYPSRDAPLIGTIAAAVRARRILEVGCGLGYSALWLAYCAGDDARVETIEADQSHAAIAEANFAAEDLAGRIKVLGGHAAELLLDLKGPYDLIFFDADPPEALAALESFERIIRPGGLLISSSLFLGPYDPKMPGLEKIAEYRKRITGSDRWTTAWLLKSDGSKALSVRR